jgi:hypothetical protein
MLFALEYLSGARSMKQAQALTEKDKESVAAA